MGLTVLSALGAGAKSDPTRILIGDLADTTNDPLAIKLRNELKTRAAAAAAAAAAAGGGGGGESAAAGSGVVIPKIQVVFSHEKAKVKLAKLDADQQANPEAYGVRCALTCAMLRWYGCIVHCVVARRCRAAAWL